MTDTPSLDPDALPEEARIVRDFLDASMVPDPERAATYMAESVTITFTGGRVYGHPSGPTAFNAMRYKWVKKDMRQFEVAWGPRAPWSIPRAIFTGNGPTARRSRATAMSTATWSRTG